MDRRETIRVWILDTNSQVSQHDPQVPRSAAGACARRRRACTGLFPANKGRSGTGWWYRSCRKTARPDDAGISPFLPTTVTSRAGSSIETSRPSSPSALSITRVSSAKRTLPIRQRPAARAASTSARFVRLLDPGGLIVARNGAVIGVGVMSLMDQSVYGLASRRHGQPGPVSPGGRPEPGESSRSDGFCPPAGASDCFRAVATM